MGRIKTAKKKQGIKLQPPKVDQRTWQALFEAADEYVEAEPWVLMGDAEAFGVFDANLGRSGWGVSLGQMGETYGLGFYQGREGLAQLRQLLSSKNASIYRDFDNVATMNMLNYNWVTKRELDEFDKKIIAEAGWPTSGEDRYHQFQSYRPGYAPWPLDEDEVLFMLSGLEAGMLMAEKIARGDSFLKSAKPGAMPMWIIDKDWNWNMTFVEPEPWEPPAMDVAVLDEGILAKLSGKGIVQAGTWEAGHFYQHGQVMDLDRPYHMHVTALVDAESKYIFPPLGVRPTDNLAQMLIDTLVLAVEKEKSLPLEIAFSDRRLLKAVAAALEKLKIKATFKASLPAVDDIKENMRDYFLKKK